MAELLEIRAVYNGPPIMLYESFKQSDIRVTAIHDDSSYDFIIPNSKITVSTLQAISKPTQECTIRYIDEETKKRYTVNISIPVIYPTKLTAKYVGDYIYIISEFDHSDVDVYIEYNYPDYNSKLDISQYKINNYTVNSLGPNIFTVTEKVLKSNNLSTEITVYGIRKIVEIRARYTGDPIEITSTLNPDDLLVEIETVNENDEDRFTIPLKYSTEILTVGDDKFTRDFYINEPLTINTVGDNIKTIHYKDPLTEWQQKVTITGIPKVIDFKTTYTGDRVKENTVVHAEDVYALVTLLMDVNTNRQSIQTVDYGEWEFYDAPIVQTFNNGVIKIQYRDFISYITVPFDVIETLTLRCWYEGDKIEVGNSFSKDAIFVYTVDKYGNATQLSPYELIYLDDTRVTEEGWNFYRVQVKNTKQKIIGIYAVPGYTPLYKEPVRKFKVVYVDVENNYKEYDYTNEFLNAFTTDDALFIDWETFYKVVLQLKKFGLYIMTAPRAHGLSNKYDEDWEVLCINNTLKSNIMKTYYKEDESWQNRRQQHQTMSKWWKIPLMQE